MARWAYGCAGVLLAGVLLPTALTVGGVKTWNYYHPTVPYDRPIGVDDIDVIGNRMIIQGAYGDGKEIKINVEYVADPSDALKTTGTKVRNKPGPLVAVISSHKRDDIFKKGTDTVPGLDAKEPTARRVDGDVEVGVRTLAYLDLDPREPTMTDPDHPKPGKLGKRGWLRSRW